MSTDNTYGKVEFIIGHGWWAFIAWIWYKSILFRCIGTHSLAESKRILLVMLLCCSVLGIVLEMKKHRNGISVLLNLIAGYGLYSVLAYYPIKRRLIQVTIRVVVILAASYSVLILCRKIKSRRKRKRILVRRIIRAFSAAGIIICTGLAVIMISITFKVVFDTSLIRPSVIPTKESDVEEQTIANNMETLALLREDTWKSLSVEEKLDVLQTIANIEQRYLGLPNELNVGTANLREGLAGYYSDSTHEIIVSIDCLLNDSSKELTNTIAHEAYHGLQYRMVDAYDEASSDMKSLLLYYDASIYKEEFANYVDGVTDYLGYYFQECEIDARRYARISADEYFERINEYLQSLESESEEKNLSDEKNIY